VSRLKQSPGAPAHRVWHRTASAAALVAALCLPRDAAAQEIQGQIVDAQNNAPVGLAAIILLDSDRKPVAGSSADVDGYYRIATPGSGQFYIRVERLGYFENETPLFEVGADGEYGIDLEMRPEPFRLDPLEVTVTNEKLENFLTLEFGQHPATLPGYRNIQGARLAEAMARAKDNTDLLRWLYIPVSHGRRVCVGSFGAPPLPERMSYERTNARAEAAANVDGTAASQCGALYLDGYRCRNEHIEEIDRNRIGVVVPLDGAVYLYTRDFDWTFRPGGGGAVC